MRQFLLTALAVTTVNVFAGTYPDLPVGIKNGTGSIIGDMLYVGLGSAQDNFYVLDLKNPTEWKTIAKFIGGERNQPISAAIDGKLYVFGGAQKNAKGELQLVNDAYRYDPTRDKWERLSTRSPRGLVGASAAVYGEKIYVLGGVNEAIFNGYFQDYVAASDDEAKQKIANAYFALRPQDYFFNTELTSYQPSTNQWRNEGHLPFSGRAGAAFTINDGVLTVVNGEIKPGLRTAEAHQGKIGEQGIEWKNLPELPSGKDGSPQEGLAGAYSGLSNNHYLVMGGANFIGAAANFKAGNNYAHSGLTKAWQHDVFSLQDGQWKIVGQLPIGMAYGVSATYDDQLIIVGGETNEEKALTSVHSIKFHGNNLTIE